MEVKVTSTVAIVLVLAFILFIAAVGLVLWWGIQLYQEGQAILQQMSHVRSEHSILVQQLYDHRQLLESVSQDVQELQELKERFEDITSLGEITGWKRDFIYAIAPGAIDNYQKHGILPSITLAQAILESGWGRSKLAVEANNIFGIKGAARSGSISIMTAEYINGEKATVQASFRVYTCFYGSISDHGELLSQFGSSEPFWHPSRRTSLGCQDSKGVS